MDPSRLQLVEARKHQAVELARIANVPAYYVDAPLSGSGMTYTNSAQARADLIDFAALPYIAAIEQTLCGPNVTPNGQAVRLDVNAWLRNPYTPNDNASPTDLEIAYNAPAAESAPPHGRRGDPATSTEEPHDRHVRRRTRHPRSRRRHRSHDPGVAVPWNQVGTVADGTRVRFLPDSFDAAARPIVTIGHDGQAIGRTADNTADAAGMSTTVKVSRVAAGDDALILAADGVLGMFSVGVNPTDWYTDDDDVMFVAAGDWHHTALLPFGAFPDAVVTDVAASQPPGGTMTLTDTAPPAVEPVAAPAELVAAAGPGERPAVIPVTAARPVAPPLTLQRIATMVASANRGEITTEAVRATIEAALATMTTTNIGSIVQPAYRAEITGIIDHGTPLMNALGSSTLPASGMSIEYPEWVTLPTTGIQAVEKTQIVSTPVTMTMKSTPVITIAGGNDISLQAVERSSPTFLDAYLRAASADWARKASAYVIDKLDDQAVVATPGTAFLENVANLLSALDPALTPAGPLFVAMSYDVSLPMISVQQPDGPAFWDGSISFGSMTPIGERRRTRTDRGYVVAGRDDDRRLEAGRHGVQVCRRTGRHPRRGRLPARPGRRRVRLPGGHRRVSEGDRQDDRDRRPVMSWATVADVTAALGVPVSNPEHLTRCVDAANAFAFRRRASGRLRRRRRRVTRPRRHDRCRHVRHRPVPRTRHRRQLRQLRGLRRRRRRPTVGDVRSGAAPVRHPTPGDRPTLHRR